MGSYLEMRRKNNAAVKKSRFEILGILNFMILLILSGLASHSPSPWLMAIVLICMLHLRS